MNPTPHSLSPIQPPRSRPLAARLAGTMLALACFTPAAFANNGTALYFDVNGTTAGFGTPSSTLTYSMIGSVAAVQGTTLTTGFANGATVTSVVVANNTGYVVGQPFNGTGVPAGVTITSISGTGNLTLGLSSFTSTAASSGTYTFGTTLNPAWTGESTTLTTGFATATAVTSVVVASATGITVGQTFAGTGVPSGVTVTAVNGTTISVSFTSTAASSGTYSFFNGAAITSVVVANTNGFTPGDTLIGTGIPNSTKITAISGYTLSVSFTPTATSSGFYNFGLINWDTSSAGTGTIEVFPSGDQMTFGAAAGDTTCQGAFTVNLDGGAHLNGIFVNSTGCFVTNVGSANTYLDASGTNYVNSGSAMTWNDNHDGSFNFGGTSGLTCTYTGGGTNIFLTDFGGNATGNQYETMAGSGTIIMNQATYGSYNLKYGFTLNSGALVFQTAVALGNVFSNLNSGDGNAVFTINGGSIDNTSGSAGTLNVGTTCAIGGNFTFVGSSSLSLSNLPVTLNATPTITVKANRLTIGGVISGGYGLTLAGAGTLALTNANNYSGNTTISNGTLALSVAGAIASPQITLAGGIFDVSGLASPFSPASGQTLALNVPSTVNGAVTTTTGAIGLGTNQLTLTGNLTLNGGTISETLSTTTNGNNGVLAVAGSLTLSGGTTMQINYTVLQTGRYKLITYTGAYTPGSLNNLTLSGIVASGRQTIALDDSIAGEIDLVITGVPGNLTWVGDGSANNWDTSTENWSNQVSHAADNFFNGDLVTFNDTGSETPANPVELNGALTPGSILVTNTGSYVFTGSGSLGGNATLTKQGPGSLTLSGTGGDSFIGGIVVSGGTLALADTSAALAGGLTVIGGTAVLDQVSSTFTGNTIINNGGTVQLGNNDANGILPSGAITDNGALVLTNSSNLTLANVISGSGALSQLNTSSVTLAATNTGFTGPVFVSSGTVLPGNTNALGSWTAGTVTVTNGGTLDLGGLAVANTTSLFGPKQFYISGNGVGGNGAFINSGSLVQEGGIESITLTANSTIGGATRWDMRNGTVSLNLGGFTLTKTNANTIALVGPNISAGNIIIGQGDFSIQETPVFTGAGTITVNPGGSVGEYKDPKGSFTRNIVLNGGTVVNDSGNSSAFLDAPILLTANSTFNNPGGWQYFDDVISDGGDGYSVTNNGAGTNILSAINTYSGNTLITVGALALTNNGSISSSAMISATASGKFDISGLSIPFSGTNSLVLGDDTLGAGTLTLGATFVTNFNYLSISNAFVNLAVVNPAEPNITVTNLNLGDGGASSTINVTALPPGSPTQFPLISYTSLTGFFSSLSLGPLPAGYGGNLVNNTANNSIDLLLTSFPAGAWTGGSTSDSDWSDANNWGGVPLTGTDLLYFDVTARLINTNDVTSPESATSLTFGPAAGAFVLYGNPVTLLTGGLANNSANLQIINLGLDFSTNLTINGGASGVIIGGGLTNTASGTNMTTLTLAGDGILTNLLGSLNSPGGTNTITLNTSTANWTIVDNPSSTACAAPWVLNLAEGTLNFGAAGSAPTLSLNAQTGEPQDDYVGTVSGAIATLNVTNGTLTTLGRLDTATANTSTGLVNQVGGTLNIGSQFQGANGATSNALSLFNVSGGTVNIGGGTGPFYVASRDQGNLTLSGGALNCGNLDASRNANGNTRGSVGTVNLNGGILTVGEVGTATSASQTNTAFGSSATFNFNGGTLKASGSSATFFQGSVVAPVIPITTIVKAGGAIIDTTNHAVTVGAQLQHDSTLGGTPDGGLLKLGSGTLTLTSASTYTGNTVVSNGTLVLNGSLGASAVTVATGATLSGTGSVGDNVTINAGGTILPATPGALGILTVASNLVLQGTATLYINQSTATNDVLLANSVAYGGTLLVTNLAGTLASGNSFTLFTAAGYSGTFAATNLPTLAAGLGWNWNPANGILSVVTTVNPNPTNIMAMVTGTTLSLTWPADHTGWTLQMQTNSLATGLFTNWVDVPGSASLNSTNITIDPTKPTVFYRLSLYP